MKALLTRLLLLFALAVGATAGPIQEMQAAALKKGASAPFDPVTSAPAAPVFAWVAGTNTYVTGTTPATNGQTVENWKDAAGNSQTLTQATSGKRPTYTAADAAFNNRGTLTGVRADQTAMSWTKAAAVSAPYTLICVGSLAAKVNDYQSFWMDSGEANNYMWQSFDTNNSAPDYYLNGAFRASNEHSTAPAIWFVTQSATTTAHRMGRNGLATVPAGYTAPQWHGFNLWRYSTGDSLHGGGKIAFVAAWDSALTSNAGWITYIQRLGTYYGITVSARANIICDGDSRTFGYQYLDNPNHHDKMWPHLLQARFTDSVETRCVGVVGREMATQLTDAAARITPALSEAAGNKKIIITINAGNNDVANGATAAVAYQRVCDYVRARHNEGALVIIGTNPRGDSSTFEAGRTALNTLILANAGDGMGGGSSVADATVDIANDADTTSANPFAWANSTTPHNPGNYSADKIHFSNAGNVIVADKVETTLVASPFSVTRYELPVKKLKLYANAKGGYYPLNRAGRRGGVLVDFSREGRKF